MYYQLFLMILSTLSLTVYSKDLYYCSTTEVRCKDRCIKFYRICDTRFDCPDGVDEKGCPNKLRTLWNIFTSTHQQQTLKAISWLQQKRRPIIGWGKDTNRAVIVLYMYKPFNMSIITDEVIVRELQFELLGRLERIEYHPIPIYELALYSHALLAVCLNPANFFEFNITKQLENELNSTVPLNPFIALALCNSNGSIPQNRIIELINILNQPSNPEWIDQQAYALMTLNCLHDKNELVLNLTEHIRNETYSNIYNINVLMEQKFINIQQENGNFGSVYTTALVVQAILSSGSYKSGVRNLSNAFNYIISHKAVTDSFNDITSAYLLLPLLNGKILSDLGKVNCSSSPFKEEAKTEILTQRVWYSIWVGEAKKHNYTMSVTVPVNATFYDVMRSAADMHKKYRFEYAQFPNGKYVTSLSGIFNDAESRRYWYLFRLEDHHPTTSYIYPDHVFPKPEEEFVYWYKLNLSLYASKDEL